MSDETRWVASRVFTDEHIGSALTENELARMLLLEEEYKDEIAMAKLMLENNPEFIKLDTNKKTQVAAKVIAILREKREEKADKSDKVK